MSNPTTNPANAAGEQSMLGEMGKNLSERADATKKTLTEAPEKAQKSAAEAFAAAQKGDVKTMVSKAVETLDTVTDAKNAVTGALGKISEDIMMPVMKALAPFKGSAILPVAKHLDPVLGCDVHMVVFPPAPAPIPMPHLYAGIIFDPLDWVSILVNTFKQKIIDTTVKAVGEVNETAGAIVDEHKEKIYSTVMGRLNLGASVKMGSYIPRAVTGTAIKNIPHFPSGPAFHPAFMAAVKKNNGKVFLGSLFVLADGDPLPGLLHLNYDCWDIGVVDLFKYKRGKKGIKRPKKPESGGPGIELYVPSSVILAIPWARVLVNPIPTPFNPLSLVEKILKAGLSKIKQARANKKRKDAFKNRHKPCSRTSRFMHNMNDRIFGGKRTKGLHNAIKKGIQKHVGHPVDVATGRLFTDNEDFSLPGPIPLNWERTWYSDSSYNGPLGYGWHHSYDMALYVNNEERFACMRLQDGRTALFDDIPLTWQEEPRYNRSEKLWLHRHPDGYYYASDEDSLIYSFDPRACSALDDAHLLTAIANTGGFAIRFAYDRNGCLTRITDSANRILTVQHDTAGRITRIDAPHPEITGQTFAIASYTYSEEGDMLAHTDALNQVMQFEYKHHLLVKETWRNGAEWHFVYDGNKTGAKCIETWGDGNLLHYTLQYAEDQTIATDSLGHSSTYLHRNGIVYQTTDPNNAIWQELYNEYDELEQTIDPVGNQVTFTHDEYGNLLTTTDPEGAFTQTGYLQPSYPFLPTEGIDAAGGKWQWSYNEAGNIEKRKNPLGAVTRYSYTTDGLLHTITDANGAVTIIAYNGQYDIQSITAPNGAVTRYNYDILGRCTGVTNPNGVLQSRSYDLLGRATSVVDFDGNIIQLQYDALDNVIKYTDRQKEVHYTYKGLWKLTSRSEAGATIRFSYDTEEQLKSITNEEGLPYRFGLDGAGNVITETGFDGLTRRYERNPAGWVKKVSRPAGRSTEYGYDRSGRITRVQYHDGSTEQYSYRKDGVLLSAANADAKVSFERDVMGNVVKESSNGHTVSSVYDILERRTAIQSSLGADIALELDMLDNVTQMKANGWQAKMEYDLLGLETTRESTGGIANNFQRDKIGRIKSHRVSVGANRMAQPKLYRQYMWDANDQLRQIIDSNNGNTTFEHDKWGNLAKTTFANGEVQLRNPDKVGNLFESKDRKDRKYDKGGRLVESKTATYKYDEEGFLTEKKQKNGDVWKYEWNAAGMLQKVIRPDKAEVHFKYDALGRRIEKRYRKTITKWVWDGNKPLHEWKEFDAKESSADDLITWVFNEDDFAPAAKIKGEKKYSIIVDHLGTPIQGLNDEGSLIWERELDSYGKVKMMKGDEGFCNYLYQGQSLDSEIGLTYNRFRYYDSESGTYISQDPIKLLSCEPNLYRYVSDLNVWIDVFGLAPTYTSQSRSHVYTHGHAANSRRRKGTGKSKFKVGEGGESFMNEVVNHPSVTITYQTNGRTKYEVSDLGRGTVGWDVNGNPVRGGTVIVEGSTPATWSTYSHEETVTMFPSN